MKNLKVIVIIENRKTRFKTREHSNNMGNF